MNKINTLHLVKSKIDIAMGGTILDTRKTCMYMNMNIHISLGDRYWSSIEEISKSYVNYLLVRYFHFYLFHTARI